MAPTKTVKPKTVDKDGERLSRLEQAVDILSKTLAQVIEGNNVNSNSILSLSESCQQLKKNLDVAIQNQEVINDQFFSILRTYEPRPKTASIQRVEEFNGEVVPEQEESKMKMSLADKVFSMTNAVKILPPNLIKDGRHDRANVEAICGFKVDEEMMDEVYQTFKHED